MVQQAMNVSTKYERILKLAKPYLAKGRALKHTRSALRFALKLLKEEGGDPDVVIPAVILHDAGYFKTEQKWTQISSGAKVPEHMEESAKIAEQVLKEASHPADKAREVISIVRQHDASPPPVDTLNFKIFKDADRLAGYFTSFGVKIVAKSEGKSAKDVIEEVEENAQKLLLTSSGLRIAKRELRKLKKARL